MAHVYLSWLCLNWGKKRTILLAVYGHMSVCVSPAYLDNENWAFQLFKELSCYEPYSLGHYEVIVLKKQPFYCDLRIA